MRNSIMIGIVVLAGCASHGPTGVHQANQQPASAGSPALYAAGELEKLKAKLDAEPHPSTTLESVDYRGHVFWVKLDDRRSPDRSFEFNPISIYVPEWDGSYHLGFDCPAALATGFEVDLDEQTGVLVLRELAPISKQGTVILACNLGKIGTQFSTLPRAKSESQVPAR